MTSKEPAARLLLLEWYAREGRRHLPWRATRNPYRVLVSEYMLQQTQVDRVIPKFEAFVASFPDFEALSQATTSAVLRAWQGLGYNSRALRLKQAAEQVVERFSGILPADEAVLRSLPGIGPYTAGALRAFAFGCDDAAIDTNVRRVLHRVLYGLEHPPIAGIRELDARARSSVPPGRGHEWNSALMDLGAAVCTAAAPKCSICPLLPVCAAAPIDAAALAQLRTNKRRMRTPQERLPFEQTTRYARGRIVDRLRALTPGVRISLLDLHADLGQRLGVSAERIAVLVEALRHDGLVDARSDGIALPE
jgi:A/G-specific adenine glycosylase